MKKFISVLLSALILMSCISTAFADEGDSLSISSTTAEELAKALVGSGVTISNISYTGNTKAAGKFSNGADIIGFDSGVCLSSGNASDLANVADQGTSTAFGTSGDSDLDKIIIDSSTYDAAVLEFDFVPTDDYVNFQYVLTSSEMWGGSFQDPFAILVNGTNTALIPGTTTPVSIINFSSNKNSEYYISNSTNTKKIPASGLTTILTAVAPVNKGVKNHIKFALADNGDSIVDTSVFIKAGSISAGKAPVTNTVTVSDSTKEGIYNEPVNFSVSDFTYSDTTSAAAYKIKLTSLPENGTLKVGSVAASVYQEVYTEDISSLSFTPDTGWSGSTSFTWNLSTGGSYAPDDARMTINIKSGNNNLNGLVLSSGTLSPKFDSAVTSYTASVSHSTDKITVTASVYDSVYRENAGIKINGVSVLSGIASDEISLDVGSNIINVEVTAQDGSIKTYEVVVKRNSKNSTETSTTGTTTTDSNTSGSSSDNSHGVDVIVNGKTESAGTLKTDTVNGKNVAIVTLDSDKLNAKLDSEGNNALVTIQLASPTADIVGELTGEMVKNMEAKLAVLEIKSDSASYKLPAEQINIDEISKQLGTGVKLSDIKVKIQISESSEDKVKIVENSAKKGKFNIVVAPVEFNVTCEYGNRTADISLFNSYVERSVQIPDGIDTSKITTGIVIESDGTVRHVPTKIVKENGKFYAKMNSLTNSTYSVIWNDVQFADVNGHWAKDAINDMGSRLIVSGTDNGNYEPERDITRAEFAAIIVRALGIKNNSEKDSFSDVMSSDWYAGVIKAAFDYKLISGDTDGKFKPDEKITREEAMLIIDRAMKLTGLNSGVKDSNIDGVLTKYSDTNEIDTWAQSAVAECVQTGIISGRNEESIAPQQNITRAEVAVIIKRLLEKSGFID